MAVMPHSAVTVASLRPSMRRLGFERRGVPRQRSTPRWSSSGGSAAADLHRRGHRAGVPRLRSDRTCSSIISSACTSSSASARRWANPRSSMSGPSVGRFGRRRGGRPRCGRRGWGVWRRRRARTRAGTWAPSSRHSPADAVGDRRAHVVEENLVDLVVAGQGDDRRDAEPGDFIEFGSARRNAVLRLPSVEVRTRQNMWSATCAPVVQILVAVDDVVLAVAQRAGLQGREAEPPPGSE